MDLMAQLHRKLAYNAWANREVFRSVHAARNVPARAAAVLAHIAAAEWLWLSRLGQPVPVVPVWPEWTPPERELQFAQLSHAWQSYLSGLSASSLSREITYRNSKGETWSNSVADVLTHVPLHSAYHRGQVTTLLRAGGGEVAYSDYIECVRRGHLSQGWPS